MTTFVIRLWFIFRSITRFRETARDPICPKTKSHHHHHYCLHQQTNIIRHNSVLLKINETGKWTLKFIWKHDWSNLWFSRVSVHCYNLFFTGLQVHNFWQHVLKSCKVDSRPHINISKSKSKSKSKNLKRNHKCHFKEPLIATCFIGSIFQLKNCLMKKLNLRFRSHAIDSLHLRTSRVLRNRYRAIRKKRKEKMLKTDPYFYIPLLYTSFLFWMSVFLNLSTFE